MKKLGSFIKKLIIIAIIIYCVVNFFQQQKILNSYATNMESLEQQLAEEEEHNKELNTLKENVNSEEYIEEMAREKLDMYMDNERVYICND